jgi:DNA invertase Pin-like site-specific DNA recombinase
VRISEDQSGERIGVDQRQRPDCLSYCAHRGWQVVEVFTDNDVSASRFSKKKRPGYQRMMAMVDGGELDVIVAWHLDRLYRQPRELEHLIERAEKTGLVVATLHGELNLQTGDGRAMARVVVTMAAKASDDSSDRIRRDKRRLREAGLPTGSSRAFGWKDGMTIDRAEARLIRQAADAVLAGATLTSIAKAWNAKGIAQPQGGKGWTTTTVRTVLTQPRNAGLVGYQGEIVGDAQWPSILDRQTFERLCAVIKVRGEAYRNHHHARRHHFLTGLVYCAACDSQMYRGVNNGQPIFRCHRQPGRTGCGNVSILALPTEAIIRGWLFEQVDTAKLAKTASRKTSGDRDELSTVMSELAVLDQRLAENNAQYVAGDITAAERVATSKLIAAQQEGLRSRLATVQGHSALAPYLGQKGALAQAWRRLSIDAQHQIVAKTLELTGQRIVIEPRKDRVPRFDPERVQISPA